MASNIMKRYSISHVNRKMQIKTKMRYHYTTVKKLKSKT